MLFFYLVKTKKFYLVNLVKPNFLILAILSLIGFIFLNFSATGCLIYPVEELCFSGKFDWALSSEVVKYLKFHYEIWSKGGIGPNFSGRKSRELCTIIKLVTKLVFSIFY